MNNPNALTIYKPKGRELATLEFEQFKATLSNRPDTRMISNFAMVGASSGVGTSTVSENFAKSLGIYGEQVLLIQISPPKPEDEGRHPVPTAESFLSKMQKTQDGYFFLDITANALPQASPRNDAALNKLMEEIGNRFAYVIWDIPPVDLVPQSRMIGRACQGVVMVLHAGRTRWYTVRHAMGTLEQAGAKVLGVVLNRKKNYIPNWIYRMFFRYEI